MVKIEDVFVALIKLFSKHKIPYMVVGGFAVAFWGEPRLTKDIDLVLATSKDILSKLVDILRDNNYVFHYEELKMLAKLSNRFTIADATNTFRIDLWVPQTYFEEQAFKRRLNKKYNGKKILLISPEDLILFKLLADRTKDIDDIKGILARQKGKLDRNYLTLWAKSLNKYKRLKKLEKSP